MAQQVRVVRRLVLIIACLGTVLLCTFVASAFSPSAFRDLRTPELVGLVALFGLPVLTAIAVLSEQRASSRG